MNWPLNVNNFTILDRLNICLFILNRSNRWTQDKEIKKFEQKMANFIGVKYAVFVSSGSTANTLLAQYIKDNTENFRVKNQIVFPSLTWQTSCAPWIREGFEPVFLDISLEDFSIDKNKLIEYVDKNSEKIACVFPTSLIGYTQDIQILNTIKHKYKIPVFIDNCENTFGRYQDKNISSYFTSSTSTYFGHQLQSIEGGFIFTNNIDEYKYFLINRNHGMSRSLDAYQLDKTEYLNPSVDPLFDFFSLGNNFRNTDLNAFIGQLDLERANLYINERIKKYNIYYNLLDKNKFLLPSNRKDILDVPFCLPVIAKNSNKSLYNQAKKLCKKHNIEYRPIISGFLGHQTCYKKYFNNTSEYQNSIYLHEYGFYVGLYSNLNIRYIKDFAKELNNL
jgi:CDP-6-deoxy-D-xylo-4-hexulose-3-dehydrase